MVCVDASSAAPSAAEDGRILLAICGLVHALLLHAGIRYSRDKTVNAVDTGREWQRAAGTQGAGSRQVRRQLWGGCRLGGRRRGSALGNPLRNAEREPR